QDDENRAGEVEGPELESAHELIESGREHTRPRCEVKTEGQRTTGGRRTGFFEIKPQRTQRERTTGTCACSCGRPRCRFFNRRWTQIDADGSDRDGRAPN